jgi:TolB-like protein
MRYLIFILFCFQINAETIAVFNLEPRNVSSEESLVLSDKLRNDLFNQGGFKILERDQMEAILKEQGFQQRGCTTTNCAVEAGQLLGVQKIITGTIGQVGSIFLVTLRIIDIKTGEVTKSVDEEIEGRIEDVLKTGMSQIVIKLMGKITAMPVSKEAAEPRQIPPADGTPLKVFKDVVFNDVIVGNFYIYPTSFVFVSKHRVIRMPLSGPMSIGVSMFRLVEIKTVDGGISEGCLFDFSEGPFPLNAYKAVDMLRGFVK